MFMKKLFVLLYVLMNTLFVSAQSIRGFWLNMPDNQMPHFNKNLRQEFLDFRDMKLKASVDNLFHGESHMDSLTSDYLLLQVDTSTTVEMKVLPYQSDSILCMVTTYSGPAQESKVEFYDYSWNRISLEKPFGGYDLQEIPMSLFSKPDTMSQSTYSELTKKIEPLMCYAKLSPSDYTISFSLSLPMMKQEDKKGLEAIILQRKFKWTGKMFN